MISRRGFIAALGGTAVAWPRKLAAQQQPVIGFMSGASQAAYAREKAAFLDGLRKAGFVEGGNVTIEYRWAEGRYDALPAFARDLVARHVAVIVATGGLPSPLAAKAATTTIPIVFTDGGDPIRDGLVSSLNDPRNNVTGVTLFTTELEAKRVQLLHDLVPRASVIGLLINPANPTNAYDKIDAETAAHSLGLQLLTLTATVEGDIAPAFSAFAENRIGALIVGGDPLFISNRTEIIARAAHHALPTIYAWETDARDGGLVSYGPRIEDMYRAAGDYVGRILKGAKPSALPVQQPSRFVLLLNLKTAKALGLAIPPSLLAGADEVIE
jgi:putative tryptophan/tyrosine transport system substrate-binding protein